MILRAAKYKFEFPRPALVMGIVNVTPDSFSDGGRFLDQSAAVAHAVELARQGADIIDVGGESTRPGAKPVSEAEEMLRVIPVIEELAGKIQQPISIDTLKPSVARAALRAGASLVNDVGANRADDDMGRLVAETGAGYVLMHMQGAPETMQAAPHYNNVVREVGEFFEERMGRLAVCGVSLEQVVLDAGIGFGKTAEHNLQLLAGLGSFKRLARPLLLGVSRKSFVSQVAGAPPGERLPAVLACTALAREAGVEIFRAHDVAATVQALRMTDAVLAEKK